MDEQNEEFWRDLFCRWVLEGRPRVIQQDHLVILGGAICERVANDDTPLPLQVLLPVDLPVGMTFCQAARLVVD